MNPARRGVDALVRARLLRGGAWSQSCHCSEELPSHPEQLTTHRRLRNDQGDA